MKREFADMVLGVVILLVLKYGIVGVDRWNRILHS